MNIINFDEIASTQTWLMQEDSDMTMSEFSVAYTENQTGGRGQGTHIWESEKGKNISFSFILRPSFLNPANQYLLTQIISLAIIDTLQNYIKQGLRIKWPNDIYVNDNKICGMLIQNKLLGNLFAAAYCGIGININQEKFAFAPNPTSVFLETGRQHDKKEIFNLAMQNVKKRYIQLQQGGIEQIREDYLLQLLYRNEFREYEYKGEQITAKILTVNEFGHLIFETKDGVQYSAELRELKFIFK